MNKSIPLSPLAPKDLARVVRSTKCLCDKLEKMFAVNLSLFEIKKANEQARINKLIEDNNLIHFL